MFEGEPKHIAMLKKQMHVLKLNQANLAMIMDLAPKTINEILKGKQRITTKHAYRLGIVLSLSSRDLLYKQVDYEIAQMDLAFSNFLKT